MRALLLAAAVAAAVAGCSSSGSSKTPPQAGSTTAIGQVVAPSTTGPASSAALGKPITQGSLTITIAGPVTTAKSDGEFTAAFHVTATNTAASGAVVSPDWYGIRCDANRGDGRPGDMLSGSTAPKDKQISAGQTASGTAVVAWLKWNQVVKCTGTTTIEADFLQGGFLAWTLPANVVAQVNAAAGY